MAELAELAELGVTPSQTVGPFLHLALADPAAALVVPVGTAGGIWLRGRVLDGRGEPVSDALVETWQADAAGRFDHPDDPRGAIAATPAIPIGTAGGSAAVGFSPVTGGLGFAGFGRCPTDEGGEWAIHTIKPGSVPAADGRYQAPHLAVSVFARGLLDRVVTRLYFADDAAAHDADPVLAALAPERRATLVASPAPDGYRFDVRLQGERETVFFAL